MFAMRTLRWVALGGLVALLVGAGVAVAQDGVLPGKAKRDGGARLFRGRGKMRGERRERMLQGLQRLMDAPDDQVKVALDAARDLGKIREEARTKAAAIVVQAFRDAKGAAPEDRAKIRAATHEKLRALREGYKPAFTEAGMKVVKALTPEQRQKIDEVVKAKGGTVDDAKLARWFAARLSRPWAESLLKARLGER